MVVKDPREPDSLIGYIVVNSQNGKVVPVISKDHDQARITSRLDCEYTMQATPQTAPLLLCEVRVAPERVGRLWTSGKP